MYWLCCIIYQALAVLVRPVCFIFKRARAPWHFLIGETEEIVIFYGSISRAPRQWPAGMEAITFVALSQVFVKYRACFVFTLRLSWQWYNLFSFLCGKENKLYNYLTIIWNKSSSLCFFLLSSYSSETCQGIVLGVLTTVCLWVYLVFEVCK